MKAIVVNEDTTLQTLEFAMPVIENPQQIIVKIAYSGLCGSDIPRIFHHGAHFYPITLGHEFSGKIVAVGDKVKHLKVGDKIASAPLLPCFSCDECNNGYYSLCKNYTFVGSRKAGGLAEYVAMDQKNAFKLPDTVSLLQGAFFEPLTVGMHGILLAGGCQNKNVIIVGAGTIGLLAMQCAKAMGASSISVIDINQERLELAKSLGADHIYNSGKMTAEQILAVMNDFRFNQLILETAGTPITVKLSIEIAGPRAQVVLIGTLHQDLNLPEKSFSYILRKELSILGSWMNYSAPWPGQEWQLISDYFAQGKIELDKLIAGIGDFEGFINMVTNLQGKSMSGKILLKIDN